MNLFQETRSQEFVPNYDESKVGSYTLPDLLKFTNGKSVTSSKQWTVERAPEVLRLFSQNVYGEFPGGPKSTRFELLAEKRDALNGKAIARQ
ncbi:MAG TPA: acetylxylan esterase, partial [Cyclobacteriaceae bacterium]|nr:acetylxylan esterase [Cyclobacteriaceae bacterium]